MSSIGIFRPRRLGHVNFWVEDVDNVAEFYRDIVGLEEVYRRVDLKGVFLSNGNSYHDMAIFDVTGSRGGKNKPGLHHFAFELENEVDLVNGYNRIGEQGFEFDFNLSADVAHCCYGRDPDGNRFEVYADVKKNWREARSGDVDEGGRNPDWQPGSTPPISEPCYPVNPEIREIADAAIHTRRASHAVLVAADYESLYRHYTDLVGLVPMVGGPDDQFVILAGSLGTECLAIFRAQPGWKTGFHHGGFELENDTELERSQRLLRDRGIAIKHEASHAIRRCIHICDPCGNPMQFFVDGDAPLSGLLDMPAEEALMLA